MAGCSQSLFSAGSASAAHPMSAPLGQCKQPSVRSVFPTRFSLLPVLPFHGWAGCADVFLYQRGLVLIQTDLKWVGFPAWRLRSNCKHFNVTDQIEAVRKRCCMTNINSCHCAGDIIVYVTGNLKWCRISATKAIVWPHFGYTPHRGAIAAQPSGFLKQWNIA
jgi:hypothetical protein